MSMGLGHKYWVHVIDVKFGTLEECIQYMQEHKLNTNRKWYELTPIPNLKIGTCEEYRCCLVELDKYSKENV